MTSITFRPDDSGLQSLKKDNAATPASREAGAVQAIARIQAVSEQLVEASIDALRGGRTILVAAHRLSTIRKADRIYVLEEGKIIESGTREALLDLNGRFRQLHDIQFST